MRLLITGYHVPSLPTLKRLILVADEIGFLDRPSVTFQNWGTIGRVSDIRQFKVEDSPITISVHESPSGPAEGLYLPYISADLRNHTFLQVVFEGLKEDSFAWKFIQPMGKHGADGTLGTELRQDLLSDPSLPAQNLDDDDIKAVFTAKCGTVEHRRALFKMTAAQASIAITSSLAITAQTGLAPVSGDSHLCRLLALRTSDTAYLGGTPRASRGR